MYIYIHTHTHTHKFGHCTSVLVNKACCHMRQLAVTLRRSELTIKYVDLYHIAVNITHGTVIAFRIDTFRVIEKK